MANKFDCGSGEYAKDPLEYVSVDQKESMYLFETDECEIYKLISKLHLRKASGYDHISNRILKETCAVITPFLSKLFNSCMG